jgi:hypothetical protein
MSLLTYEQARPFARAMKQRTALARSQFGRGAMPPWFIEKNIGIQTFKEDPSLSDEEIALFAAWADNGAPEGDPADLPPARVFASAVEWTLGKPDLVVSSPPAIVKGVGADWWGEPWDPVPIKGVTEDRYISSIEYREITLSGGAKRQPGSTVGGRFVIHHAGTGIASGGERESGGERYSLTNHEVGRNGYVFPQDAGVPLKVGSRLEYSNVHFHPSGVADDDRTVQLNIGLRLHPKGYAPKYVFQGVSFGRSEIEVNPNEADQRSEAYWVAPQPVRLVNYEPHMHAAGVRMCLEAIYERAIETLNCAGYDHNWVRTYNYDDNEAPLLPKGTILKVTGWFDSTARNANVLERRNQGNWGRRTVVNMFMLFEQMVFLTDEQYQQELAKRREHLDRTQGWDAVVGCPGCWERPAPTAAAASR